MRDIQQLQECGFDIICQRSRMNQYSIGERILELPELKLLIDAVEAARFIPQPKSEALIEKLSSLASQYQAKHLSSNIYTNKRVKSDNARVYYSIDLINQAIILFSINGTQQKVTRYTVLKDKDADNILMIVGVYFCTKQLGKPWALQPFTKPTSIDHPRWQCSTMVWAAYNYAGVDVEQHGLGGGPGITPHDVRDADTTTEYLNYTQKED